MADVGGIAGDRLKSFVERIERLEEERRALSNDIKEVYAEAKGTGFDTKVMRQIIRLRRMAPAPGASPRRPLPTQAGEVF